MHERINLRENESSKSMITNSSEIFKEQLPLTSFYLVDLVVPVIIALDLFQKNTI